MISRDLGVEKTGARGLDLIQGPDCDFTGTFAWKKRIAEKPLGFSTQRSTTP